MAPPRKPFVGAIVHYRSYGAVGGKCAPACRAAIVTEVNGDDDVNRPPDVVGLAVLNPTGAFFHSQAEGGCPYDGSPLGEGGTWHWPEAEG